MSTALSSQSANRLPPKGGSLQALSGEGGLALVGSDWGLSQTGQQPEACSREPEQRKH
jgi:hypothetical protein